MSSARIMVVDDDPQIRRVLRTALVAQGYEAVDARNGEEAIERLGEEKPDLIILDVNMPRMNGLETCRVVRSTSDVPIIMLSGHGDRWRVVEAARIGAHEYLLKPVSTNALLERIVTILSVPRPFMQLDGYYGPAPRKMFANTRPVDRAAWQADVRTAKPDLTRKAQPAAQSRAQPRVQPSARHGAQSPPDTAGSGNIDDVVLL